MIGSKRTVPHTGERTDRKEWFPWESTSPAPAPTTSSAAQPQTQKTTKLSASSTSPGKAASATTRELTGARRSASLWTRQRSARRSPRFARQRLTGVLVCRSRFGTLSTSKALRLRASSAWLSPPKLKGAITSKTRNNNRRRAFTGVVYYFANN